MWTHDGDCKNCIDTISEKLKLDSSLWWQHNSFSYKNLDNILQECWKKGIIDESKLKSLVAALREERRVSYLYKKEDNSSELRKEILDNNEYIELVMNDKIEFIY